jgi:uncharacterized membrane protein
VLGRNGKWNDHEQIPQLLEKLDSATTPENNVCFWTEEGFQRKVHRHLRRDKSKQEAKKE